MGEIQAKESEVFRLSIIISRMSVETKASNIFLASVFFKFTKFNKFLFDLLMTKQHVLLFNSFKQFRCDGPTFNHTFKW